MSETMTSKERWLAAVRMQPVDRLPFWPKLDGGYPQHRSGEFKEMTLDAIHDWIGSDKHKGIAGCVRDVRKNTSVEHSRENGTTRKVFKTPHGEMECITRFDAPSNSWHPVKLPIQTLDDVKMMTEFHEDVTVEVNEEGVEKAEAQAREIGSDAVTTAGIGESPLMNWVEWLAGVENAHFMLMDHTEEVEALFDAIHRVLVRRTEIIAEHSPADLLYMIENTSTTLISPDQYRKYCAKHVGEYARIASASDRNMVLHMCGHLKALLGDLADIPARAFEAFTSPTLGDTTLLDGRTGCPDKCLIGGTNAMLWTKSADEIIAKIEEDLNALPHHRGLVVTSAGVMPPMCEPETIRQVCDWVKSFPVNTSGD